MGFRSLQGRPVDQPFRQNQRRFGSGSSSGSGSALGGSGRGASVPEIQRRPLALSSSRSCCASFAGDHDLVGVCEPGLEPVGSLALGAAGAELLQHLLGLTLAEPDVVAGAEDLFDAAHSCGFSGVPGRPSGNISTNLRATASGTSSSTFPPKLAISFTPLDETKLTCGLAIT